MRYLAKSSIFAFIFAGCCQQVFAQGAGARTTELYLSSIDRYGMPGQLYLDIEGMDNHYSKLLIAKKECSGKSCDPLPDTSNGCNDSSSKSNPHCNPGITEELDKVVDEIIIIDPIVTPKPPANGNNGGGTCNENNNNSGNNSGQTCPEIGNELPGPETGNELPDIKPGNELPGPETGNELPGPETGNELPGPEIGIELPGPETGNELPDIKPGNELPGPEIGIELPDIKPGNELPIVELPPLPSDPKACFAEEGDVVYVPSNTTCSVATVAGKNSTGGYKTVALYPGSQMLLNTSNINFKTETSSFLIDSAQVLGEVYGINAKESDSRLDLYIMNSSKVDIPFLKGSAGNNNILVEPQSELRVSEGIAFQGGNDTLANQGKVFIRGSVVFGDGDDNLLQDGEKMIIKGGVDFGDGDDVLQTNGLLEIGDGPVGLDGKVVDGGRGFDRASFWDKSGKLRLFPRNRIQNFEQVYQQGGVWQYYGDLRHIPDIFVLKSSKNVRSIAAFSADSPARFENFTQNGGNVIAYMSKGKNVAPIEVDGNYNYIDGNVYVLVSEAAAVSPEGRWNVVAGNVSGVDNMAKNTTLVFGSSLEEGGFVAESFDGLGKDNVLNASSLYDIYLEKGSLNIMVESKTDSILNCSLNPTDPVCKEEETVKPDSCQGSDCEVGNKLPDSDGDGNLDRLPGCELGDDLCDIISDIPGDEDEALGLEEEAADDVIDGLLDGLAEEEIDLPLSFDYGQLAKLVVSGLLPRNVDAPGRSLFNYNNLMVDTIFERLPLRQFKAVEVSEVVEEEAVIVEPEAVAPAEPIRGLWSQTEGMDEQQAQEYLAQRVAQGDQVVDEGVDFELDGIGYVEDPSLTAQYANRDGVRAWYKAFGGDLGPTTTSTLYGNYNASASGMVVGADVSLGSNVQIGVFGNYGDVNLYQYSGDTGSGSWNPTGWGGGITADWWSENFYVQGLISASSFSGNQKRNIIAINEQFGNETARGDKNVTSYSYALRLGAPFEAGRLLLEPQFTAAWTQNQESGFTENGADQLNLRYGSRTTNFLQTELGMKFALPIQSGERGEWVPNLRVAWLGDWNQNNEDQSIGYAFTDKTVGVAPLEDNQNGVLIEGGLDYTMANINTGSWKLYVRGGAEVWGGERGTDWRGSGGLTWQF